MSPHVAAPSAAVPLRARPMQDDLVSFLLIPPSAMTSLKRPERSCCRCLAAQLASRRPISLVFFERLTRSTRKNQVHLTLSGRSSSDRRTTRSASFPTNPAANARPMFQIRWTISRCRPCQSPAYLISTKRRRATVEWSGMCASATVLASE